MGILTYTCPHCNTAHMGLRLMAYNEIRNSNDFAIYLHCPKCDLPSGARIGTEHSGKGRTELNTLMKMDKEITHHNWRLKAFWPEPPAPLIPDFLPPDIGRVYLQAERNFPVQGNEEAAGTMYRKALDIGLKKIDPQASGTLGQKIKKLAANGKLTVDIETWSGNVRDLGNDAAHEEEPLSREELGTLRNFTEMVLRYLFTLPNMVKKRKGEALDWEDDDAISSEQA